MSKLELKIPPPVVMLMTAVIVYASAYLPPQSLWTISPIRLLTIPCIIAALIIAGLSVQRFIQAKTTIHPQLRHPSSQLVTTGIYAYTRNPMYLSLLLCLFALACYLGHIASLLSCGLFVLYINQFQIKPEEAYLLKTFPSEYANYQKKVRRWV